MIELYVVAPEEDEAFLAAFAAHAPPGHTLYTALREDTRHRFVSVDGPPRPGAILVAPYAEALHGFEGRQGCLAVERHGDLGLVHWSSPLMYARATGERGALYVPA